MLLKVIFVCSNIEKCFAVQSQVGALGPTLVTYNSCDRELLTWWYT